VAVAQELACGQIWGGNRSDDLDLSTGRIRASLFSSAAEGGKGGDIYYLTLCNDGQLTRLAVVDVVGHGLAVSNTSQWLYDALAAHMNQPDTEHILAELNDRLMQAHGQWLTTAALAVAYPAGETFHVVYAGHPPILVLDSASGTWRPVESSARAAQTLANIPLGVSADTEFRPTEIKIKAGDRMVLYSDGVIEAPDANGDLFGLDRLQAVLNQSNGSSLAEQKRAVLAAVREHTGGRLDHDDVTFLSIEIAG
jgi:sigma-B regulation protein RsbU (phosphoserine phosphatase)